MGSTHDCGNPPIWLAEAEGPTTAVMAHDWLLRCKTGLCGLKEEQARVYFNVWAVADRRSLRREWDVWGMPEETTDNECDHLWHSDSQIIRWYSMNS